MTEPIEISKVSHSGKFDDYTVVLYFEKEEEYYTIFLGGNKPLTAFGDLSEDIDDIISWSELPEDYQKYIVEFVEYKDFTKKDGK